MESKQNDLMLNIMENPGFGVQDFLNVGLNADNTSLEDESTYVSSPRIQNDPLFKNSEGQFDLVKFHNTYQVAQQAYNVLATSQKPKEPIFSKYNIFAPIERRNLNPEFQIVHESNPDLITRGLYRIGEEGPRKQSREEIAQTQPVIDYKTGKELASPNDDFWGTLFGDTRVLAQYEKDVDINGKVRGEKGFDENNIEHYAGENKLNENGTYYYETAGGRNIHGKQVLHMSDILTTDGSALNAIDFFDSDGLDKNPVGAFIKNASLVGSLFMPYVGPYITVATILQQSIGLGATLGKVFASIGNWAGLKTPDSIIEKLNYLEGFSESTNFLNTRSEYSKENVWTIENAIGMIGDTVAQLKQQRALFKYSPALFKGKWGISEKKQLALQEKYLSELNKIPLAKANSVDMNYIANLQRIQALNASQAAAKLESYMKDYYNVGEVISKAYMTVLTVEDMFEEAREAGADDTIASLLTLGYAATEYALLSSDLGKWILPELRVDRQKARGVFKALTKDTLENFEKLKNEAVTPEQKRNYIYTLLNWGKKQAEKVLHSDYALGKGSEIVQKGFGVSKYGIGSIFAGALAEGTEEVSEEILSDLWKGFYNATQSIRGAEGRFDFGDSAKIRDRYLMNFLGGFFGGGISAAGIDYKQAKSYANLSFNQAVQELIYMDRNNELDTLYKILDSDEVGNKNLSATKILKDSDGNVIGWEQGDKDDNQDQAIKSRVKQLIDLIHTTLESTGGTASNDELLSNNLQFLKDLKYQALKNTTSAGKFIQRFNELDKLYIEKALELRTLNSPTVKASAGEGDQKGEENTQLESRRKEILKEMEEIGEQIKDMRDGKMAPIFMANALIEATPFISQPLMASTYRFFVEKQTGKNWEDLSDSEKTQYIENWNNYQKTDMKDDVELATQGYLKMTKIFSQRLLDEQKVAEESIKNFDSLEFIQKFEEELDRINQELKFTENPDVLIEQLQKSENYTIEDSFTEKLKVLQESLKNKLLDIQNLGDVDTQVNSFKQYIKEYGDSVKELFQQYFYPESLMNIIQEFENSGYINGVIRNRIFNLIDKILQAFKETANKPSEFIDDIYQSEELNIPEEVYEVLDGFDEPYDPIEEIDIHSLNIGNELKERLSKLNYTPINDILNSFILGINPKQEIQFNALLTHLNNLYGQTYKNISQFVINDSDILKQLYDAIQYARMLESVVEGARNDSITFDTQFSAALKNQDKTNLFGINTTLNQVHKAAPKIENDPWEDLPEISGELADFMLSDIRLLKNQLEYYQSLHALNSGQKLNSQIKISTNLDYILYKKLSKFAKDVVPDDWDKTELEKALDECKLLQNLSEEGNLQIPYDVYSKIELERISLENAVWKFFNISNKEKFESVEELSKLLDSSKLNLLTPKKTLLNESTQDIDDNSFVSWLATKSVLNAQTHYNNLKEVFSEQTAPLAIQDLGIGLHLANVINRDVISRFAKALKKSKVNYWKSLDFDKRRKYISGGKKMANFLSLKCIENLHVNNSQLFSGYETITFVEGVPGSGKSDAVNRYVVKYLTKYYQNVLDNAWVVHVSEDDAKKYGENIGLSKDGFRAFDRMSLMKEISDDWTEPTKLSDGNYQAELNKDVIIDSDDKIISKFNLKNISELPKVIIIDEVSRFTHTDLLLLDKFAKKYGISVITTGDLDQTQSRGMFKIPKEYLEKAQEEINKMGKDSEIELPEEVVFYFAMSRNMTMHTPKIAFSLRTANSQKTKNLFNLMMGKLELSYYESDNNLYGDKLVSLLSQDAESVQTLKDSILNKMIPNLKEGEKIGLVYYSKETTFYKTIMGDPKISKYIEEFPGNSSQGKESQYWLIEINPKLNRTAYKQELYTGVTRAQVGSIILQNSLEITPIKENTTQIESLKPEAISNFTKRIKKIYDQLEPSEYPIEYQQADKEESTDLGEKTNDDTEEKNDNSEEETKRLKEEADAEARRIREEILRKQEEEEEEEEKEKEEKKEIAITNEEEFILPEDTEAWVENNKISFSQAVPVSYQWINKYFNTTTSKNITLPENAVYYIVGGEIDGGSIKVYLANNYGDITTKSSETTVGEVFNNEIDLNYVPTKHSSKELTQEFKRKIEESAFTIPEGISMTERLDAKNNLIISFIDSDGRLLPQGIPLGYFRFKNYDFGDNLSEEDIKKFDKEANKKVSEIIISPDGLIYFRVSPDSTKLTNLTIEDFDGLITIPEGKGIEEDVKKSIEEDSDGLEALTEEQTIEALKKANSQANYGKKVNPESPSESTSKDKDVLHLLYSFNTFETGIPLNKRSGQLPRNWKTYLNPARIDNIHGLRKAFQLAVEKGTLNRTIFNDFKMKSFDELTTQSLIEILSIIRDNSYHIKEKQDLENFFSDIFGLDKIYCRFAIKNFSHNKNLSEESSFWKFFKDKAEKILFHRSGAVKEKENSLRNLVLIVGSKETISNGAEGDSTIGDFFEVPLLTLNNPFTMLHSIKAYKEGKISSLLGGKEKFSGTLEELFQVFKDSSKGETDQAKNVLALLRLGTTLSALANWSKNKKIAFNYRNIKNLINLYLNMDRCIYFMPDEQWTIGKSLKCLGPQINTNRGLSVQDYDQDLIQKDQLIDLEEFAARGNIKVSEIMTYTRKDGKYEYNGGVISGFMPKPGTPFVFYTDDLSLSEKGLQEQYIRQKIAAAKGEPYEPKVKIAYVMPPTFSIEEYTKSIKSFILKQSPFALGNLATPLKVLHGLFYDAKGNVNEEFKEIFINNWADKGEEYYNDIKNKVDELSKLSQNDLNVALKSHTETLLSLGLENKSMSTQLQNVIKQLFMPSIINFEDFSSDAYGTYDEKTVKKLSKIFKKSGLILYDHARLQGIQTNDLFARIVVQQDNPYSIDNGGLSKDTKFKVHGNMTTSLYQADKVFNDWLELIGGTLSYMTKSQLHTSPYNKYYTEGDSSFGNEIDEQWLKVLENKQEIRQEYMNKHSFGKKSNSTTTTRRRKKAIQLTVQQETSPQVTTEEILPPDNSVNISNNPDLKERVLENLKIAGFGDLKWVETVTDEKILDILDSLLQDAINNKDFESLHQILGNTNSPEDYLNNILLFLMNNNVLGNNMFVLNNSQNFENIVLQDEFFTQVQAIRGNLVFRKESKNAQGVYETQVELQINGVFKSYTVQYNPTLNQVVFIENQTDVSPEVSKILIGNRFIYNDSNKDFWNNLALKLGQDQKAERDLKQILIQGNQEQIEEYLNSKQRAVNSILKKNGINTDSMKCNIQIFKIKTP